MRLVVTRNENNTFDSCTHSTCYNVTKYVIIRYYHHIIVYIILYYVYVGTSHIML